MVISGYSFNNTTGDFTYTMRDPDENSYQYIYSTYSASSVGFVYAGNTYIWEMSIYDWH